MELNSKGLRQSSGKEKKVVVLFRSSTKREIRQFHVVVVQRRQRNVQKKRFARAESFCFACLNVLLFCRSRCRRRRCVNSLLVNLSNDVFERRTSTGSGFFSFSDSGFAHYLGQLVSIIVKTLRNANLGASRCFKMKKTSLPVDVSRSKTPLLKVAEHSFAGGQR